MGAARVVVVVSTLLEHQLGDLCCATRVAERVLRVPVHVVRVLRATIIRESISPGSPVLNSDVLCYVLFESTCPSCYSFGWRPEDGDTIQVLRAYRAMRKRGFHSNILSTRFPKREFYMYGVLNEVYL